jgi:hypothetical protein
MDRCIHGVWMWLALAGLSVLVCACNAGQSDNTDVSVQGNWSGQYAADGAQGSIPVFAFIRKDGSAYLFDSTGVIYALPRFTGSEKVSGPVTAYPAMGFTFADGSSSMDLDMNGTAASTGINVDLDGDGNSGQARSGQAQLLPLETYYGEPSVTEGQWTGDYVSPAPQSLALGVKADGSFSGNDAYGCRLQGHLTQLGEQATLFAVSMQSTGPSPACGGSLTGLAHESSYDTFNFFQAAQGTYYYFVASNAKTAFVAELKVQ